MSINTTPRKWRSIASFVTGVAALGSLALTSVQISSETDASAAGATAFAAGADISVGATHVCGIDSTNELYCWGDNTNAQLGDGTTTNSSKPVKVVQGSMPDLTVTDVTVGEGYTCAINNSKVYCWGNNVNGTLGNNTANGTYPQASSPQLVSSSANSSFINTNVTAVEAGPETVCAIEAGKLFCWGANKNGEIGDGGSAKGQPVPLQVPTGNGFSNNGNVTAVSIGYYSTCAIDNGKAYCWGTQTYGSLGNPNVSSGATKYGPQIVADAGSFTNANITHIAVGSLNACAITGGKLFCWGNNSNNQLGNLGPTIPMNDNTIHKSSAFPVPSNSVLLNAGNVTSVTIGEQHACAVESSKLICWGNQINDVVGDNAGGKPGVAVSPTLVATSTSSTFTNSNIVAADSSAGATRTCLIHSGTTPSQSYCWGTGYRGQLGNGDTMSSPTPSLVCTVCVASAPTPPPQFGGGLPGGPTAPRPPAATTSPATTTAPAVTTTAPSVTTTVSAAIVAGQTVSDPTVYTTAPKKVSSQSAINVLTPTEAKTQKIVSSTPAVCLPTNDEIVFIDEGRCSVSILNTKSGQVLRRMRTTVIDADVVTLDVGNEVAVLAPIFFDGGSDKVNAVGTRRIRSLKAKIDAAGSVLVVGHSGTLMGDTPENREMSRNRAINTVKKMKRLGATGPFYSIGVGVADPADPTYSREAQSKNRRVVIVLVP